MVRERSISIHLRKHIYEFVHGSKDYRFHKVNLWYISNQIKYYNRLYHGTYQGLDIFDKPGFIQFILKEQYYGKKQFY